MKATRPYGDIFEYDPTPLGPDEHLVIQCDGKPSTWVPTVPAGSHVPPRPHEASTASQGAKAGQTSDAPFVTAGVDVQADGVAVSFYAWPARP
jgi:hypothetical protein